MKNLLIFPIILILINLLASFSNIFSLNFELALYVIINLLGIVVIFNFLKNRNLPNLYIKTLLWNILATLLRVSAVIGFYYSDNNLLLFAIDIILYPITLIMIHLNIRKEYGNSVKNLLSISSFLPIFLGVLILFVFKTAESSLNVKIAGYFRFTYLLHLGIVLLFDFFYTIANFTKK